MTEEVDAFFMKWTEPAVSRPGNDDLEGENAWIAAVCRPVRRRVAGRGLGRGEKEAAERVVKVVVMQPVKMEFVQKIRVQGNVETKAKAEVSSRISGTLDLMKADEGQRVRKGDILFQVDRIKLENDVKGQKHKLAVAEAELKIAVINNELARTVADKAQVDFNRADQLRKANAVSDDAYERAALNLKEAEAGVSKAEAQANYARAKVGQEQANLEIAEKNLSDSLIRAPFDGMVILKKKDPDEFVNTGDIIYRLEDPDRLELVTMISAVYYDRIVPGKTRAVIYAPNGSVAGEGIVGFRSPAIDSLSRTFTVKIDIPKEFHMVGGQLCELDLILRREEESACRTRRFSTGAITAAPSSSSGTAGPRRLK